MPTEINIKWTVITSSLIRKIIKTLNIIQWWNLKFVELKINDQLSCFYSMCSHTAHNWILHANVSQLNKKEAQSLSYSWGVEAKSWILLSVGCQWTVCMDMITSFKVQSGICRNVKETQIQRGQSIFILPISMHKHAQSMHTISLACGWRKGYCISIP